MPGPNPVRELRNRHNETSSGMTTGRMIAKYLSKALVFTAVFSGGACIALAASGFPSKLEGHGGPIRSISVSTDGKTALTASFDYAIIVWDLTSDKATIRHRLFGHDAAVNDVSFVPGTNKIVSVSDDGSFAIWNASSGKLISRLDDTADKVLDVAVSNDGKRAAVARWDGTARLFDVASRSEIARLEGHRGSVNAVTFSDDGATLYTGSYDGTIRAWDTATGVFLDPVYDFGWGINVLAVNGDDTLIFGALDGTLAVVDLKTGVLRKQLAKFERPVLAVDVSPNGQTIAAGNGAGFIHLYDSETLSAKRDAAGSFGPVWGIAFTGNEDALYHVGLDDFATWHDLGSENTFQPIQSKFPRRFQLSDAESIGQLEFQRKCSVCHTLTPDGANRAGPTLYDVFGRRAGTLRGYEYSNAIKEADIIWNSETISRLFDEGPDIMIPGTKMPLQRLKSIDRRAELVEFLRVATAPQTKSDAELKKERNQ